MADSAEREKAGPELHKLDSNYKQNTESKKGNLNQYIKPDHCDQCESYRKFIVGKRDITKPHKTILLVGETGSGKTTLINTMINYMLDVKREDGVWFEIIDESDQSQAHSQTSIITVYEFYLQKSKTDLTIIDTPGYGDTCTIEKDKEIAKNLLVLSKSKEEIHEIDAVCLVNKSTQTRLTDKQKYIFDAVQSLFGNDIAENIVLLLTFSRGAIPKNVLMAVKEANFKCAVDEKNQPVYFLFDNCQSEPADEKNENQIQLWNLSHKGIQGFFIFLNNIKPKPLKLTQGVLQKRLNLESKISSIVPHVEKMNQKQNELKQTQAVLEQYRKAVEENKNFESEEIVSYREMVEVDSTVGSEVMCCPICMENCPVNRWWENRFSTQCATCKKKCHYNKHVKGKIYFTKTEKVKRTNEDLKKEYDEKISGAESKMNMLKEDLHYLEIEKVKKILEAFQCVETLELIALNTDSRIILRHADFLIEKLKEINEPEKAKNLEEIKQKEGNVKKERQST